MLQLRQRFMKFSTKNFLKIFRGIIPEKYRYWQEYDNETPKNLR